MYEKVLPRMREQDIFIGQPLPQDGFNASRPQSDERSSITSRVVREYKNNPVFLIMPYTHDPLYVSWSKELVADLGKNPNGGLILVGGKIWERNWDKSPFAQIKIPPKIHVEMGINPADYPRVKHSFNPKGKRRFFYIGHDAWYKNTSQLEEIAKSLPDFEFAHIGGGSLKGWKKIDEFASLTPQYMSEIARNYDIFVNTSSADAQATTILENMCFGFPIATTYEAGYDFPSLIQLSTTDTVYNTKALLRLQDMDESELLEIANVNRKAAESFHGWSKFTDTILNFMKI
ncbi:MAG TPA: glycosyltransferase [Candidatus Paceibacterota bacterium]|nr:glycosyltransferase [Candidatus Paceibacterota bacterium]